MTKPTPETKDTVKKLSLGGAAAKSLLGVSKKAGGVIKSLFSKKPTSEMVTKDNETSTEYLGEIYKMMKTIDADKKLHQEMAKNHIIEEEHKKDIRNKEIINALAGKKNKSKFKPKLKTPPPPPDKTKPDITKSDKTKNKKHTPKHTTKQTPKISGSSGVNSVIKSVVGVTIALTGVDAAWAKTIKMESNPKNEEDVLKKVYQSVKDTNNTHSLGLIGLNSGRGKNGKGVSSLDSFISDFNRDYPNEKITEDPGPGGNNPKFVEQWNKANPQHLLAAQKKWYKVHVYDATVHKLENAGVNPDVASDERVQTYMADRMNQNGSEDFDKSLKDSGALKAKTAEEFINKMSEYDKKNVGKTFGSNIKQFGGNRQEALEKRIDQRTKHALETGTTQNQTQSKKPEPIKEPIENKLNVKPAEPEKETKNVSNGNNKFTPLSEKGDLSYNNLTDAQKDAVELMFRSNEGRFPMYNDDSGKIWNEQIAKIKKQGLTKRFVELINEAGSKPVKTSESLAKNEVEEPKLVKPESVKPLTAAPAVESKPTILPHTNERTNSGVDNINIGELMSNKEKEDRQRKKWEKTLKLADDPISQTKVKEEPEPPPTEEQLERKRIRLKEKEAANKLELEEAKNRELMEDERKARNARIAEVEAKSEAYWKIRIQEIKKQIKDIDEAEELRHNWDDPLFPAISEINQYILKNSNQTRPMIRAMFDKN